MQIGKKECGISDSLAEFISCCPETRISSEAYNRACSAVMDYIGVTMAGADETCAVLVRKVLDNLGGRPQATIWGSGSKTSVEHAALANGVAAHALDFDDTNPVMLAHPSLQLLPGLFAVGEYRHSTGREMLNAYIIGFEVGAKLGRALNPGHVSRGWLPIGTLGPLMQAAACARLLRLTPAQTQMAVGLATNLASGIRCNNGTMAKPFLAGQSASNGVIAALLAGEGMTASPVALEGQFGYYANFGGTSTSALVREVERAGERFDILDSGISFKPYPCCAGAHGAIGCALEIAQTCSPQPDEIESIDISIHSGVKVVLIHPRPVTVAESRFSLEYSVARALIDGRMGPEQFSPGKIDDPEVRALIERVKPEYCKRPVSSEDLNKSRFPVEMKVRLKTGTVYSSRIEYAKGSPENPLSAHELEEKFRQCCTLRMPSEKASVLIDQLKSFEQIKDIADLIPKLY